MTALSPRLQQLRAELEASDASADFGPTVLLAVRRELLRYLLQVPYPTLQACSPALKRRFEAVLSALRAAATFPARSRAQLLQEAQQAGDVLLALDTPAPPPAPSTPPPRRQRS
ncbi:hypothetical protein ACFPAF_17040 [Hymenobacter endophyticus]|uniref:Uncharacterized protein n=1 Tax=Hymenobacter endophyticus TaxID=3076335 RepID=A0ABU3TL56_9BACT|nr:hypothetical protein [Hymenobacter endophyticus]MDU0372111.1 hypothetical protein [Hymenobacter endophyticus]